MKKLSSIQPGSITATLVVVYIYLAILNLFVVTSIPRRLLILVGFMLIVYEAFGFGAEERVKRNFLYVIGMWVMMGIILNSLSYHQWPKEIVYIPGNIGVALALCRKHLNHRVAAFIFYSVAVYFGIRLIMVANTEGITTILTAGSQNAISEVLLSLCVLYYICRIEQPGRIPLLPGFCTLFIVSITLGRSGIASASLLLVGLAIVELIREPSTRHLLPKLAAMTAVALILALIAIKYYETISFILNRYKEFGFTSEGRSAIWDQYVSRLDWITMLIGYQRSADFAGFTNVHNSFLLWHKSMGIATIPLYTLTLMSMFMALFRKPFLFVLMAALLLRAFFDEFLLPFRIFDFLYYYLICTLLITPRRDPLWCNEKSISHSYGISGILKSTHQSRVAM